MLPLIGAVKVGGMSVTHRTATPAAVLAVTVRAVATNHHLPAFERCS